VQIDLFVLYRSPQALHEYVVAPAALAVHADADADADFERDLTPVKKRANARALGHVEGLINPMPVYQRGDACSGSMAMVRARPFNPS
jgi:hypothetical protein